ncbi:MAG: cysteine desulfurase family protein [Solirubrobacterales bacterium]|nr:cysteine desulfurase family protein [Solirubrobacterales bacterium]
MSATHTFDIAAVRERFSSLSGGFVFFDGPGGTQVPDSVGDAIAAAMRESSANLGAPYATSRRATAILEEAERRAGAFFSCRPDEITFGMNMTSLNFTLSRTASRDWQAGDRVLVSALDHDANVAPWIEVARDHDLDLQTIAVRPDTTLDLDDLRAKLNDRTRVVAFTAASNAVGTLTPVREISDLAHAVGALSWVDGVHFSAHEPVDVEALGADVMLCSTYKFCGPHLGFAYARAAVAETWRPYKVRPLPTPTTGRKMSTGTFPFEALAGLNATFDYLDEIGGMAAIGAYERTLAERFLTTLPESVIRYGLPGLEGRLPTFVVNVDGVPADVVSEQLGARGVGVWSSDTWYSLGLYETLGFGDRSLRIGMTHYNTAEEVDRLVAELSSFG